MLEHELCRVPVTALAFAGKYLLAGEGPFLKVYDAAQNVVCSNQLFTSQSIHGIRICEDHDNTLIVWGGSLVSVVILQSCPDDISRTVDIVVLFEPVVAPDWILHAQFRPAESTGGSTAFCVALITAHNSLLLLDFDTAQPGKAHLRELTSQSKCILYSAHILWTGPSRILVASGTVFGDIVVWSCQLTNHQPETFLHQVLTGHDGSIFGVQISPELYVDSQTTFTRLLASCSDDRTVRIWDLTSLPAIPADPQSITDLPTARETGFGTSLEESLPGDTRTGRSLCQAWGHMSRIWTVDFVKTDDPNVVANLITFGEDATCHYWSLEYDSPVYTLENAGMLSLHNGKNIWSSALRQTGSGCLIATGGADGSIATHLKDLPFPRPEDRCILWSLSDATGTASLKGDKIRSYAFIDPNKLVVAVNSGNLFLVDLDRHRTGKRSWTWLAQLQDLQGYSIASSLLCLGMVLLSGRSGSVYIYHHNSGLEEITTGHGKTAALFLAPLGDNGSNLDLVALVLVTTLEQDAARLLVITRKSSGGRPSTTATEHILQLPRGFIVTSFAASASSTDSQILVLGSRNGELAVYDAPDLSSNAPSSPLTHALLVHNTHGDNAVTDLKVLSVPHGHSSSRFIYSAGRDGTLAVYELSLEDDSPRLQIIHQLAVPETTTVEQIELWPPDNEYYPAGRLMLCAFRSKHFIVYDMMSESEVYSINCGGANRTWAFVPSLDVSRGTLAWTKASQLCVQTGYADIAGESNRGGHGREIKSIAISPRHPKYGRLIATGAEDTDIKIHMSQRKNDGQQTFECIRTIKKHNTGIQHLEWSDDGRWLFSSGGFEELFAWRVRDTPLLRLGVICESVCPPESELPDLRIMHFAVLHHPTKHVQSDVDMFTVSTVRSDSTIRIYTYRTSEREKVWTCTFAGTYLSCSLTQILRLPYIETDVYITTATDGHVGLSTTQAQISEDNSPEEVGRLVWQPRIKTHQSTVHCTALRQLGKTDHVLFSGGDDNALSVTRLAHEHEFKPFHSSLLTVPRAHTAAITGLAVIDLPDQPHVYWLLTTSIDQRVKLWQVSVDTRQAGVQGIAIRKLANVYTPVADASGLATYVEGDRVFAVVCGVGMDVWSIDVTNKRHRGPLSRIS